MFNVLFSLIFPSFHFFLHPHQITWIDGLGNVLTDGVEYIKKPLGDTRRFTAKSILKLTPKKEHHNTTFTCQAQNTADRTYRSVKMKLEVKYAPKVQVKVIGGALAGGRIPEGAEIRLSCRADANPTELTYRWSINDRLVVGDYTTEMVCFFLRYIGLILNERRPIFCDTKSLLFYYFTHHRSFIMSQESIMEPL